MTGPRESGLRGDGPGRGARDMGRGHARLIPGCAVQAAGLLRRLAVHLHGF